jgi:hypothetical protein
VKPRRIAVDTMKKERRAKTITFNPPTNLGIFNMSATFISRMKSTRKFCVLTSQREGRHSVEKKSNVE